MRVKYFPKKNACKIHKKKTLITLQYYIIIKNTYSIHIRLHFGVSELHRTIAKDFKIDHNW